MDFYLTEPIDNLRMVVRTENALKSFGVFKISELISLHPKQVQNIPHMTYRGFKEIRAKLYGIGLNLKNDNYKPKIDGAKHGQP
jgi:DNA-directed RNA polymerase alpha subunit